MIKETQKLPTHILFSKALRSQLTLLNILYRSTKNNDIYVLIEKTYLNRKTIYKYIKELNILSNTHLNKTIIEMNSRNNYLFLGDKIDFLVLRSKLLDSSTSFQLAKELLTSPSINIYRFCLNNYISESNLKKNIKRMNDFALNLGISLKLKKNEIFLVGDEGKIRYIFATIFWRTYNGIIWPFDSVSKEEIEQINTFIFKNQDISPGKKKIFSYIMAINIIRSRKGYHIVETDLPIYYLSLTSNSSFFLSFSKKLSDNFPLDTLDAQFILMIFYAFPEYYLISKKLPEILKILEIIKNNSLESYNSIQTFINFVALKRSSWEISSSEEQEFISAVISSRISVDLLGELFFNIQDLNLIEYFSYHSPLLIPTIRSNIKLNCPDISNGILDSLSFKYSQAYLLAFPAQDFEPEIIISVISDSPLCVEKLLVLRIKHLLSPKYNLKILTTYDHKVVPDLIIATASYEEVDKSIPTIYVFPQIDKQDSVNILKKCDEIFNKKIYKFTL